MKEILITSSVLIVALLLLRLIFAKKVRRTLVYAAWLLAALRLLIPVQIGQLNFSVLTAAKPVTQTITEVADKQVAGVTEEDAYREILQDYVEKDQTVFLPDVQEHIQSELDKNVPKEEIAVMIDKVYPEKEVFRPEVQQQVRLQVEQTADPITLGQIATVVWLMGVGAMAVWFIAVNFRYGRKLRRSREKLDCTSPIPVYVSKDAVSPCLVGLFRPVVYLTPGSVASEETKRHVLAHELTHLRHADQIWSVVRCICLCVYWFHPLVWVAAYFSRRDCELACDEGALKRLGEQERIAYGKSLLEVVAQAASPVDLLHTATSMNETKKQLKERVNSIVKKPKISLIAAICLVLACAIVAGCAAAGATTGQQMQQNPTAPTTPTTQAPIGSTTGNSQATNPTDSSWPTGIVPQNPTDLLAMIPDEEQLRIRDAYLTQFYTRYPEDPGAIDHTSLRVFGVFGDTYVLFVDGVFAYMEVISRGTFGLVYSNSQNMYIYHNGHFYCDLEANGILTDEEVKQVVCNYYNTYPYLSPENSDGLVTVFCLAQAQYKHRRNFGKTTNAFTYDENGNVLERKRSTGDVFLVQEAYKYDERSNRIEKPNDIGGKMTCTYDAFDRVLTETWFRNGEEENCYTYDSSGNLILQEYKSNGQVSIRYIMTYNEAGQILTEFKDYSDNRDVPDLYSYWEYDAQGNLLSERIYYEDVLRHVATYTYDAAGRMQTSQRIHDGEVTSDVAYFYDEKGNLIRKEAYEQGISVTDDPGAALFLTISTYEYDAQGNLLKRTDCTENGPTVVYQWTYDAQGNMLSEERGSSRTEWTYDEWGNVLTYQWYYDGELTVTVTYSYISFRVPAWQTEKIWQQQEAYFGGVGYLA